MQKVVTAKGEQQVRFRVNSSEVVFTAKAMRLPVRRKDSYVIVDRPWFPLSQLNVTELDQNIEVEIPCWLYEQKVGSDFIISE